MIDYTLPQALTVCGAEYEIRSDFRQALDIYAALNDPELTDAERGEAVLGILYPSFYEGEMPPEHLEDAVRQALWFLGGGEGEQKSGGPKLLDWEQDFPHIITSINRVAGCEVRALPYLHWWTFLGYFNEMGECLFSQIVSIRKKLKSGKKLDKQDREWYRKNRDLVDFKRIYTDSDEALFRQWSGT